MRVIHVTDIDSESFKAFSAELFELEKESHSEVELIINSTGGYSTDGLAFYSRIVSSKCWINCTVYGACYSAAILVLAACKNRRMARESWCMVHQDRQTLKDSPTSDFEVEAQILRRMEDQYCRILEQRTGTSKEAWDRLHRDTTYMTAEDCKKLNLITEIV